MIWGAFAFEVGLGDGNTEEREEFSLNLRVEKGVYSNKFLGGWFAQYAWLLFELEFVSLCSRLQKSMSVRRISRRIRSY